MTLTHADIELICGPADANGRRPVVGDPNLVFDLVSGGWLDDDAPLLEGQLAYLVDLASRGRVNGGAQPDEPARPQGVRVIELLHACHAAATAIRRGTKVPLHGWAHWQHDGARQTWDELHALPWGKAAAVGVVNGTGGIRVFDIDAPKDPLTKRPLYTVSEGVLTAVLAAAGLPANYEWSYQSGSGAGWGIVVRCGQELPDGWGSGVISGDPLPGFDYGHLELRWSSGQTVIHGDHPEGPGYRWRTADGPQDPPDLLTAEEIVNGFEAIAKLRTEQPTEPTPPAVQQVSGQPITAPEVRGGLKAAGVGYTEVAKGNGITFRLDKCLTSNEHTDGAALLLTTSGQEAGKIAYKCHHDSCSGKQWADVKQIVLPARSAAQHEAAKPFRLDDIGNAERFVAQHGQRVRFVHRLGRWLIYDGRHWAADDNALIEQLAAQTTRSIYEEASSAAKAGNEQLAADLSKWARASAHLTRRRAMLETAKSDPLVAIRFTELDKSPILLNCRNGTINLETGELLPHDPAHLITHCLPVEYDPAAPCPQWDSFLTHILPDESTRRFVQKAVGYSLSGLIVEQILLVLTDFVVNDIHAGKRGANEQIV